MFFFLFQFFAEKRCSLFICSIPADGPDLAAPPLLHFALCSVALVQAVCNVQLYSCVVVHWLCTLQCGIVDGLQCKVMLVCLHCMFVQKFHCKLFMYNVRFVQFVDICVQGLHFALCSVDGLQCGVGEE